MQERLSGKTAGPPRCLLIQPCFRHFDLDSAPSGVHLSLFLMGAALYFDSTTRGDILKPMVQFLMGELTFEAERLWLTVFAGGKLGGHDIPPDEESAAAWVSLGLPSTNVVRLGAEKNFWREGASSGQMRSGICGPHAEVFLERRGQWKCTSDICLPGCTCGRYLELGNAIFPCYQFAEGKMMPIPFILGEAAIGLDRLTMVSESVTTVFETSSLKALVQAARAVPLIGACEVAELFTLVDHIRSFCYLVAEGAVPGGKGRGHILRRMLRKCVAMAKLISDRPLEAIAEVASLVLNCHEIALGIDLTANVERISTILERELRFLAQQENMGTGRT